MPERPRKWPNGAHPRHFAPGRASIGRFARRRVDFVGAALGSPSVALRAQARTGSLPRSRHPGDPSQTMSASSRVQHRTLADILVDQGLVPRDTIDEALQIKSSTGETLTAILIDMGAITSGEVAKVITLHYQLPFVS